MERARSLGHVALGIGPGDGPAAYHSFILNAMTPETESSCHYFWRNCRDYDIGNAELTKFLCGATAGAFEEDKAMLEHQQSTIDREPDCR